MKHNLEDPTTYASTNSECDLIMKGGISSGIVYPKAACTLAADYRLRRVGGASAGAIAAALVAAAELGRAKDGFVKLARLPNSLGDILADLFQPSRSTKPAFGILSGWLEPGRSVSRKLLMTAATVVKDAPAAFAAGIGALIVIPLVALLLTISGDASWLGMVIAALVWVPAAVIVSLALAAYVFGRRTLTAMTGNGFGLCDGHTTDPRASVAPLTDWMTSTLEDLAGIPSGSGPLTLGHLWGRRAIELQQSIIEKRRSRRRVSAREIADAVAERQVDLEVMTTSLTFQRPYRFPFATDDFHFCVDHLRSYFPEHVVAHMVKASARSADGTDKVNDADVAIPMRCPTHDVQLFTMPPAWEIPVVLAARLSLSFPGLISAVPFFAVDWSRKPGNRGVIPIWFSDGGISSNFPMHFFDSPFPGRPTFGVNLRPVNPDYIDQMVWKPPVEGMPGKTPEAQPLPSMFAFGHSILNTMQNWVDTTQITMPGYRDRIVTVRQKKGEGGMNLRMPSPTIQALAERGADAAALFADFDFGLHRWIRYRVAMPGADDMLTVLQAKYDAGFRDFIGDYGKTATRYRVGDGSATEADAAATSDLMTLAREWVREGEPASAGDVPAPRPDMRFVPRQ